MEFNRTKNSTRNFIFGIINRLSTMIFPLITRTIVIVKMGSQYAGLSGLFTSVLSVLNMSELGISVAVIYCLYKPVAENDKETINAILNLLRKLYHYVGGFILIAGLLVTPFLQNLIKGDTPPDVNIYLLYLIYLVNASITYLSFAYKDVLFNVYQRKDISHNIHTIAEIIKYIAQIIVLLIYKNYYLFALMLPISTLIINILTQIKTKQYFPDLEPIGEVKDQYKKEIRNKVFFYSVNKITSTLVNSADNIVISAFIGLNAIALYGNYNYISTSLIGLIITSYIAVNAAVGNTLVTERKEKIYSVFQMLWLFSGWVATWCSICLLCLYQPFMILWLGNEYLLDFKTVVMIVLFFHTNTIRQFLTTTYINAAGLWNKTLFRQILTSGINLILDIVLAPKYGITGIVFASFFACTFIGLPLDIRIVYKNILRQPIKDGYIKVLLQFLKTFVIGVMMYCICCFIPVQGFTGFALKSVVCLLLPNLICYMLYKGSESFIDAKAHLMYILKKR